MRLLPDLTPFRRSRDLRLLVAGEFVGNLGAQATLVALPFQLYLLTHSPALVGLLGAVELGPLAAMSLFGGALADRHDRRRLLLASELGVFISCGGLAAATFLGRPSLATLYVLGGLLAGSNALQNAAQSSMLPALVGDRRMLGPAVATAYSIAALTMVLGPGLGGLLIGALGVRGAYVVNATTCLLVVMATLPIAPQPPHPVATVAGGSGGGDGRGGGDDRDATADGRPRHEPILRSIGEGLRYVAGNRPLVASFGLDLVAMTFGMPRALFPVLAVSVFHAGASGTGLLYAAVPAGATIASALTGWIRHARRLGVIAIWAVTAWGAAIALAGAMDSIWLAAGLLAVAGAADSVSAVCRSTINQSVTPERLRGRMSSVFGLVVTGGPRLGDIESGSVAGLAGVRFSVVSGGLACLAGVGVIALTCRALVRYDTEDWLGRADVDADAIEATSP